MPDPDRWEAFAREDAELYILGRSAPDHDDDAREQFFRSGRATAAWMLDQLGDELPGRELAIEIGCGVGRLAIPMAECFTRVIGVDIAPTMLRKLDANCRRFGRTNVLAMPVDATWDRDEDADFVYSWLVLQHIADTALIASLAERAAGALKSAGILLLQFDTRRSSPVYRARNAVPDALLPRPWRRGIRRVRRSPAMLNALFASVGLNLVREIGPRTAEHVFILQKP
jgi:SAM-dependent methyltransferase